MKNQTQSKPVDESWLWYLLPCLVNKSIFNIVWSLGLTQGDHYAVISHRQVGIVTGRHKALWGLGQKDLVIWLLCDKWVQLVFSGVVQVRTRCSYSYIMNTDTGRWMTSGFLLLTLQPSAFHKKDKIEQMPWFSEQGDPQS